MERIGEKAGESGHDKEGLCRRSGHNDSSQVDGSGLAQLLDPLIVPVSQLPACHVLSIIIALHSAHWPNLHPFVPRRTPSCCRLQARGFLWRFVWRLTRGSQLPAHVVHHGDLQHKSTQNCHTPCYPHP